MRKKFDQACLLLFKDFKGVSVLGRCSILSCVDMTHFVMAASYLRLKFYKLGLLTSSYHAKLGEIINCLLTGCS